MYSSLRVSRSLDAHISELLTEKVGFKTAPRRIRLACKVQTWRPYTYTSLELEEPALQMRKNLWFDSCNVTLWHTSDGMSRPDDAPNHVRSHRLNPFVMTKREMPLTVEKTSHSNIICLFIENDVHTASGGFHFLVFRLQHYFGNFSLLARHADSWIKEIPGPRWFSDIFGGAPCKQNNWFAGT